MELHQKASDIKIVKRFSFLKTAVLIFSFFIMTVPAHAYMVKYKEDFYRLYHVHYQQYPDDCIENIYWLEKAVQADFSNPLYADTKITSEKEWEKYRYLYMMHLNLKLIEQHLRLGRTYDKKVAYFYDAPWKDQYLDNLNKAKSCYTAGLYYWKEAMLWAEKANAAEFNFLYITGLQDYEDERERIKTGELDYGKMLNRELTRVQKVIDTFVAMDSKNY
jgi:hypothetical protein